MRKKHAMSRETSSCWAFFLNGIGTGLSSHGVDRVFRPMDPMGPWAVDVTGHPPALPLVGVLDGRVRDQESRQTLNVRKEFICGSSKVCSSVISSEGLTPAHFGKASSHYLQVGVALLGGYMCLANPPADLVPRNVVCSRFLRPKSYDILGAQGSWHLFLHIKEKSSQDMFHKTYDVAQKGSLRFPTA